MCLYDLSRFACTGETIQLLQRCPLWRPATTVEIPLCIPHIRNVLVRPGCCHVCAATGLEAGAVEIPGAQVAVPAWEGPMMGQDFPLDEGSSDVGKKSSAQKEEIDKERAGQESAPAQRTDSQ